MCKCEKNGFGKKFANVKKMDLKKCADLQKKEK